MNAEKLHDEKVYDYVRTMLATKVGDIIEVQDCHHAEPHFYEISEIRQGCLISQPGDYKHNYEDIIAIYRKANEKLVCIFNKEKFNIDTKSLAANNILHEIESFYMQAISNHGLYYDTLKAAHKYRLWAERVAEHIEAALKMKLKHWQFEFIFFNKPMPEEVKNTRMTGKTTACILKACLSNGKSININPATASKSEMREIGSFMADDACSDDRAKVWRYEFVRIYSILKQHEKYIPLRTFYF